MIYIYDLILNWSDLRKYEFFEWNDNDDIEYIKKIPIFRINNFDDILDNNIRIQKDFLSQIHNKTEVYGNKKIEKVEYGCVFCDRDLCKAIAIEFNELGDSIYKSNIYFYDLDDVFELGSRIEPFDLKYKVTFSNKIKDIYLTRVERKKKKFLVNEINSSYRDNNIDKLKYMFFEVFGEESENIDFIKNKLLDSLNNNYNSDHEKIYNLIKIPNFL